MRRTSAAAWAAKGMTAGACALLTTLSAAVPLATPAHAQTALPQSAACDTEVIAEDGLTDVADDNVHERAIDCAVAWGLANGTGAGSFSPAASVSRGQMASFMARLVTKTAGSLPADERDAFNDDAGSPHESNINALAAASIVAGTGVGNYSPGAAVNRGQMASFLVRTYEHRTGRVLPAGPDAFSDDDRSVHEANIDKAVAAGFARGTADGRYAASAFVRRDQMGSFLTRVLEQVISDTTVQGTCAPVTVAPQDNVAVPVRLPAGRGQVLDAAAAIGLEGPVGDAVVSLDNTLKDSALLVGREGAVSAASVLFRDGARQQAAARALDDQGRVVGTSAPLDPLGDLRGDYVHSAWSLLILNAGDQPLRLTGCAVSLRMAEASLTSSGGPSGYDDMHAVAPLGGLAPASADRAEDDRAPLTVLFWMIVGGTSLTLLAHPRTARRSGAAAVCVALAATGLVAMAPTTPASAQEVAIPAHPWGIAPDGRGFVAGYLGPDIEGNGETVDWGLFSVPRDCAQLSCHTRLTSNESDRGPSVSPSGQQLAFTRKVGDGQYLFVLDLRTGQARQMTQPGKDAEGNVVHRGDSDPAWSPDEQTIVASSGGRLFTIPTAGGAPRELPGQDWDTSTSTVCAPGQRPYNVRYLRQQPAFSSDGSRLFYTRGEATFVGFHSYDPDGQPRLVIPHDCYRHSAGHLFSAPAGDIAAEARIGSIAGVGSLDTGPDDKPLAVVINKRAVLLDPSSGAEVSVVRDDYAFQMRWSPSGTHLTETGHLVMPNGEDFQPVEQCRNDSDPDNITWHCYSPKVWNYGEDLQCSKGNCLSGIAVRATWPSGSSFNGAVRIAGALNGVVTDRTLFGRKTAGTHSATLTADNAVVQAVTCDDTDSTGTKTAITFKVADSEIVTCVIDLGFRNDRDGDDISDDIDACPDDPLNGCILDRDGDGIPNDQDPCPDDATNSCEQPPPPPTTQVCKPFQVDVAGDIGGLEWFQFDTYGRVCSTDPAGKLPLLSPQQSGNITMPAGTRAILSAIFEFQYDPDSNASAPAWSGASQVALTGSFDICSLPLPGAGKLGAGFNKLMAKVHLWGGDRLIGKVTTLWLNGFLELARLTAKQLDQLAASQINNVIDHIEDSVGAAIEQALSSGISTGFKICVPMWEPTVTLTAKRDGTGVQYLLTDQGIPTVRLLRATNAVG